MGMVPHQDPQSVVTRRGNASWTRYRRLMKWMALAALVAVICSLFYLKLAVGAVPLPMLVATVAGVGISVLLGTALMGLVFLSNSSGHDDAVRGGPESKQ